MHGIRPKHEQTLPLPLQYQQHSPLGTIHLAVASYGLFRQSDEAKTWTHRSDCNPIEHAWHALDRAVRSRDIQPSNLDVLATALQEEWRNIGQRSINKLVESMPRRIQAVIDSRGRYTKY
jgi:hypothetical protein